ncbi:hypothetical protein B0O99DRAFT_261505 [Bisporella sp. PMI_857]|nr:hypothetical protein B0O99DRAFT_261505 [Bisporella sp. PMI_857]
MAVSGRYFGCTASNGYPTVVPTTCFVTAHGCDNVNIEFCKRCRLLDIDADFACMPIYVYANTEHTQVGLTGWGCNSVGTNMTVYVTPTSAFGVDPSAIHIWSSADRALAVLSSQLSLSPTITSTPPSIITGPPLSGTTTGSSSTTSTSITDSEGKSNKLDAGAISGIAGAIVGFVAVVVAVLMWRFPLWLRQRKSVEAGHHNPYGQELQEWRRSQ